MQLQDVCRSPGTPVKAKLAADGVNVIYSAPAPPLIPPDHDDLYREDFDEFLDKVACSSPIRRCETSSASLPISWYSSRDSLLCCSPSAPISLNTPDFAPQIMTDEYVPSPPSSSSSPSPSSSPSLSSSPPPTCSSLSSSVMYTTYIPDRDLNPSEVEIIENEYTILEYSDIEPEYSEPVQENSQRAWKSNTGLSDIKEFWERLNPSRSQYVKYASDSNICDASALENGLRNIPKDKDFSSAGEGTESEAEGFEDHIYCRIHDVPGVRAPGGIESGFFSYEQYGYYDNVIPEEPSDYEDSWTEPTHINLISVPQSKSEDGSIAEEIHDSDSIVSIHSDHVTLISVEPESNLINLKPRTMISLTNPDKQKNKTNQTNPTNLDYVTNQINQTNLLLEEPSGNPRLGSVKDLRRLFENGFSGAPSNPAPRKPAPINLTSDSVILLMDEGCLGSCMYIVHKYIFDVETIFLQHGE